MNTGKTIGIAAAAVAVVIVGAFAFYMIDIDQTQEARLPDVKIEGGQAPKFDADVGSIDVKKKDVEVAVPKVTMEKETVSVPTLDVKPPRDDNPADNVNTAQDGQSTDKQSN